MHRKKCFSGEMEIQSGQKKELIGTQKQIAIGVNKFKNEKERLDLPASAINVLEKNVHPQSCFLILNLKIILKRNEKIIRSYSVYIKGRN